MKKTPWGKKMSVKGCTFSWGAQGRLSEGLFEAFLE